jgi:cell division protein FtsB
MRFFVLTLATVLLMLQFRLWVSDQGVREVSRLKEALATQLSDNRAQAGRNRQLAAEVADLKEGMSALEERARSELGMIGNGETFYQVVTPSTPAPPAEAAPLTARAE